jgi:GNAT superfamily N-acetyltransferase
MTMTARIEPRHDLTPTEIDAIERHLYDYNSRVTGRRDAKGLGFTIRGAGGDLIGVAAGYTWAGISELKQMWVAEQHRGLGYATDLLNAFIAESKKRGARRIWVASYDFQAPGLYENAGFERVAAFEGWPEGHTNLFFCKSLE